jgi:DNA-binding NarL/FixJ family response regulator
LAELNVLLVGGHETLLKSLADRLRSESGFTILGTLRAVGTGPTSTIPESAQLVLMDVDLAEEGSLRSAATIRDARPDVCVLLISAAMRDRLVEQALGLGIKGLLRKDELPQTLIPAINTVMQGGLSIPADLLPRIIISPDGARLTTPPPS